MGTIADLVRARAAEHGDRTFLYWGETETSYAGMDRASDAWAAAFLGQGLRKGDRIAFLLTNRAEYLHAFLGCAKAGLVAVTVNVLLKPAEVGYIVANSGASLLLTEGVLRPLAEAAWTGAGARGPILDVDADAAAPADPVRADLHPDDRVAIVYTSGTTGRPKGAVLSHGNYIADTAMMVEAARMRARDRFLGFLPLFHVNAQVVTFLGPFYAGAQMILLPGFKPKEFLASVQRYQATAFSAVPTVYAILLATPEAQGYDLSSLRYCICGAAPMPVEVFEAFEKRFHTRILEGYGLSEGTCASAVNPVDGVRKVGSIGRPFRGQELRILDADHREIPVGEVGEVCVRGPNVMQGYHDDPEATAAAIRDGWLHTGDLGRVDEDGYVWLVGRRKEMIIRGGENIYPKEIEEALYRHPAILEAAVCGVPDQVWGEEVVAFLVPRPGQTIDAEGAIAWCKARLADYKCPRRVVVQDALPKTATGKIQKGPLIEGWVRAHAEG